MPNLNDYIRNRLRAKIKSHSGRENFKIRKIKTWIFQKSHFSIFRILNFSLPLWDLILPSGTCIFHVSKLAVSPRANLQIGASLCPREWHPAPPGGGQTRPQGPPHTATDRDPPSAPPLAIRTAPSIRSAPCDPHRPLAPNPASAKDPLLGLLPSCAPPLRTLFGS